MKKTSIFLAAALVTFLTFSCENEVISENTQFPALDPISYDTNAGNWVPILLSKPDEFAINQPILVTSPDYKLELLEIKSRQNAITSQEESQLRYWSAGVVLRWNEIMRDLVAKYNLPPYQNPDGTYPIPSAGNPLAYPFFPFANPPYAARAYAYLTAAQYDALVAAYHYKSQFRRPRPSKTDPSIKQLVPMTADFVYPCEEAVAAGASAAILTMMFPGEQEFIQTKLQECVNTRILAGANTRSDIDAGIKLGKDVASKFIGRARNDGAGKAVGTPADWKALVTKTEARGETPWISQETPARPPMLPLFGKVISFLMDTTEVISNRPSPPPSTYSPEFQKELEEVLWYSQNPDRDRMKVVHFWSDGAGTYTPPGHWNDIACRDFVKQRYSEVRWARNLALLNMSMFSAAVCCWDAKYAYYNPRPSQMHADCKTLTGLPNFPAFTSGHSTFSGAAAKILAHLVPAEAARYLAMADEASKSRLWGALHYRSDIEVGMTMGLAIGQKAINRAKTDGAE